MLKRVFERNRNVFNGFVCKLVNYFEQSNCILGRITNGIVIVAKVERTTERFSVSSKEVDANSKFVKTDMLAFDMFNNNFPGLNQKSES